MNAEVFTERWHRADGPLGNGWRSAHEDHGRWWDPMELRGGIPVNIEPDQGPIAQPDNAAGRCAAYRDFGSRFADKFRIGMWWTGRHDAVGGPVACINPEDPDWGLTFVYEPEIYGGTYVLWALGRQPHEIRVVQGAAGGDHVEGTPVYYEMQVSGGSVTCYANEREILTAPIPPALRGATKHGFCLDVNPIPGRPANEEVVRGPLRIAPLQP